ncbi:MAG: hypothetical protein IPN19_08200 [Elusimicrobia bacterium]|nr:hypothetical protein [Elusimicrobiota bacterium]
MDNVRLKIRVGEKEFEAEGPRDAVEARWAEAKEWIMADTDNARSAPFSHLGQEKQHQTEPKSPVFDVDHGKRTIRLRVLPPRGESIQRISNALLLLLYGYHENLGKSEVQVTRMAEDLRMSGFAGLKRLSRAFARLEADGLAARNGAGKGTRYRATHPGLTTAANLAQSLSK